MALLVSTEEDQESHLEQKEESGLPLLNLLLTPCYCKFSYVSLDRSCFFKVSLVSAVRRRKLYPCKSLEVSSLFLICVNKESIRGNWKRLNEYKHPE
mmetsp:Transcript_5531/g.6422  ORF Transcript_5531/g.6422 Transcript_5531/m.6422 type:complete len:97 (+) Transcript_5531:3054-3344(+)